MPTGRSAAFTPLHLSKTHKPIALARPARTPKRPEGRAPAGRCAVPTLTLSSLMLYGEALASENRRVNISWPRTAAGLMILIASAAKLFAGGSGLNLVVVVNQNSTNSVQLGNYYCERRQVPPQNLLRITWTGGNITWTKSEFETVLRAPLNALLSSRRLTNQIDYVLLSMDIPYRVTESALPITSGTDSTTSSLYYGFKPDGLCPT